MKYLTLIVIIVTLFFSFQSKNIEKYQDGDIIFQTSTSSQSKAIQLATNSKYSHCGILFEKNKKWIVLEAVQPVKETSLDEWINRGNNKHYVIKRLIAHDKISLEKWEKAYQTGKKFIGKDYDITFEWSDDKIYCSELVWKIYKRGLDIEICNPKKLKSFNLENPTVKAVMKKRYGNKIPYNELVVSPEDLFSSEKLKIIDTK
jgi:uncharacterized protein YycO